ncbi:hypothetical protein RB195_014013 [Necator americanus]|uniref:Peptidase C1A papain C-terminal domain-containing protein n=1 Tax=Necator americanus TaxID=51031 RepID=A0ABR1DYM2_NECAM
MLLSEKLARRLSMKMITRANILNYIEQLRNRVITREAESLTGEALAEYVNKNQQFFKAAVPKFSMESMKAKLMDVKYLAAPSHEEELAIDAAIPDSFDARVQWPQCSSISNIRDQSDCGSCWAFGAAEAMSDRICIASNGNTQVTISVDDVLSCCGKTCGDGCEGGYPIEAWRYWMKHGICTGGSYESQSGCKPYPIPPCGHHANQTYYGPCPENEYDTPVCTNTCIAGYPTKYSDDKHYGKSAYGVAKTVQGIQKEIMTNGPVEAAYTVYEDFYQYTGGVYVHTAGKQVGGHAVRILGWGVDNQTPYWLVANSWNTDWGENGYFRIVRGLNECGIEHAVVAGLPN